MRTTLVLKRVLDSKPWFSHSCLAQRVICGRSGKGFFRQLSGSGWKRCVNEVLLSSERLANLY